jgi:hypothetical protein
MVTNISNASTREEIIELIHPKLLKKLPVDELDEIALNILLVEKYFCGSQHLKPTGVKAMRVYSTTLNQITQIEYEGLVYTI